MKIIQNWLFSLALLLFVASCAQEVKAPVDGIPPLSGEVEYEISYSKDIVSDLVVGQFLPKSFVGEYNKNGIRIGAGVGFGMVKFNLVLSPVDSYIDLKIPEDHLLVSLEDIIIKDSLDVYDAKFVVERDDNLVDVCGYKSKSMNISIDFAQTNNKHILPGNIEIFYAPIEGVDFAIAGVSQFTVPGLITAMKLSSDDTSIMLMLKGIKERPVSDEIFKRPSDAKIAKTEDLAELYSKVQ